MNEVRAAHGLAPVHPSPDLAAAAAAHDREMLAGQWFDHSSPDGEPFWRRIGRWYGSNGRSSWAVGENILWETGTVSAASVVAAWMGSPEHRANLLSPTWREAGVAVLLADPAGPRFDGGAATLVTLDLGARGAVRRATTR